MILRNSFVFSKMGVKTVRYIMWEMEMKTQGPRLKSIRSFKGRQQSIRQPWALLRAGPVGLAGHRRAREPAPVGLS